jgi:Asp-tRNA(Asn)/Glu-tRNA(Gln) amidotransferase A subunit family amidase
VSDESDIVVDRVRAVGTVIIGKSDVSELGYGGVELEKCISVGSSKTGVSLERTVSEFWRGPVEDPPSDADAAC